MPVLPCPDCGGRVPIADADPQAQQRCPACGITFRPVRAALERAVAKAAAKRATKKRSRAATAGTATADRPVADRSRPARRRVAAVHNQRFESPEDGFDDSDDQSPPGRSRSGAAPPRRAPSRQSKPARREAPARRTAVREEPRERSSGGGALKGLLAGGAGTVFFCLIIGFKIWARFERAENRQADRVAANVAPAEDDGRPAWEPDRQAAQKARLRAAVDADARADRERFQPSGFDPDPFPASRIQTPAASAAPPRDAFHDPFFEQSREQSRQRMEESRQRMEEMQRRQRESMDRLRNPGGMPNQFGRPGAFGPPGAFGGPGNVGPPGSI